MAPRADRVRLRRQARAATPPRSVAELLAWAKRNPGPPHAPERAQLPRLDVPEAGALRARARPGGAAAAGDRRELRRGRPRRCGRGTTRCGPQLWRRGAQFPENGPAQRQLHERRRDRHDDLVQSGRGRGVDQRGPAAGHRCARSCSRAARSATRASSRFRTTRRTRKARWSSPISCSSRRRRRMRRTSGRWATSRCSTSPSCRRRSASASTTCRSHPALPTNAELGTTLLEPHPSWMTRITAEWERRYTK